MVGCKIKVHTLLSCFLLLDIDNIGQKQDGARIEQKEAIEKRRRVNKLYFNQNISKSEISRRVGVSRKFVIKWTKSPDQDLTKDDRGWKKGRRRVHTKLTEKRIADIRGDLEEDPKEFFVGATAIQTEWRGRYDDDPPPLRTIGQILSDLGLTKKTNKSTKGASRYLNYPEHTIYQQLGDRVLEADYVGEKYIGGRTKPLNFIGYSFKQEPKLRYFNLIRGKTTDEFIRLTDKFFTRFETPDVVKVDNAAAHIGSTSAKRSISRAMAFLFEMEVHPVYSVPRKPFTQASIEGNNSVFSRKFWNKREFSSVEEVEKKLEWFNASSMKYTGYSRPEDTDNKDEPFIPKAYFTRQVRETEDSGKGKIDVLNEKIVFPSEYVNYYVLAEWNLLEEKLYIRFEQDKKSEVIKTLDFPINEKSKEKYQEILT